MCDGCRIKLTEERSQPKQCEFEDLSLPSTSATENFTHSDTSLDYLNKSLELVGESSIKKKTLERQSPARKKFQEIKHAFKKIFSQILLILKKK